MAPAKPPDALANEDNPHAAAIHQVGDAAALWATLHLGDDLGLGTLGDAMAVQKLARYAVSARHDRT
jgi:hypothetical protein